MRKLRTSTTVVSIVAIILAIVCVLTTTETYQMEKEVTSLKKQTESLTNQINKSKEDNEKLNESLDSQIQENQDLKKQLSSATSSSKPTSQTNKSGQKVVYLTFDDGPSNLTSELLDILKENDVKATFFVVGKGNDTAAGRALMKREVSEGHTVGAHSYTHKYDYIYANQDNFSQDFNKIYDLVTSATGVEPKFFRFPGGTNNTVSIKFHNGTPIMPDLINFVKGKGLTLVDWNTGGMDAKSPIPSKETILNGVVNEVSQRNTAIVLLHDGYGHKSSIEAVPEIIQQLKGKGYVFKPLTDASQAMSTKPATKR